LPRRSVGGNIPLSADVTTLGSPEDTMAFKPNYNQQRAERNRAKQAKQEAKLKEQEEQRARRKAAQDAGLPPEDETLSEPSED
jgi:hypothetical protein